MCFLLVNSYGNNCMKNEISRNNDMKIEKQGIHLDPKKY